MACYTICPLSPHAAVAEQARMSLKHEAIRLLTFWLHNDVNVMPAPV